MTENIIKKMRLDVVMNQSEFARALGVRPECICRYEAGTRKPAMPMIRKLMEFAKKHKLKVRVEDFLNGHD